MNKKYIILFIGGIVLFIIFISVIFFQQNPSQSIPTPSTLHSQNPAALQQTNQTKNISPTAPLAPLASTPQEATRQFYTYYFSSNIITTINI